MELWSSLNKSYLKLKIHIFVQKYCAFWNFPEHCAVQKFILPYRSIFQFQNSYFGTEVWCSLDIHISFCLEIHICVQKYFRNSYLRKQIFRKFIFAKRNILEIHLCEGKYFGNSYLRREIWCGCFSAQQ